MSSELVPEVHPRISGGLAPREHSRKPDRDRTQPVRSAEATLTSGDTECESVISEGVRLHCSVSKNHLFYLFHFSLLFASEIKCKASLQTSFS